MCESPEKTENVSGERLGDCQQRLMSFYSTTGLKSLSNAFRFARIDVTASHG